MCGLQIDTNAIKELQAFEIENKDGSTRKSVIAEENLNCRQINPEL